MPERLGLEDQRAVLAILERALPDGCALLAIGGTAMILHGIPGLTTKDVDVVLALLDRTGLASPQSLDGFLETLGGRVRTRPEDGSWVRVDLDVGGRTCPVDIVRGRSRDRPSDTFVHKGVLERVVARAERRGRVLLPSLSDLIVMKAWAVVDQERLASKKGGAGGRRAAYEADARRIADVALRRNALVSVARGGAARGDAHGARPRGPRRARPDRGPRNVRAGGGRLNAGPRGLPGADRPKR